VPERAPQVRFIDTHWPLLLCIGPQHWDEAAVREMTAGYEPYFERGERYALVSHTPRDSMMGAKERKILTDWTNTPRVRQKSGELCVASSTVVRSTLARGALTAIMWLYKPASPHFAAATPAEGVDWCLAQLTEASVVFPRSPQKIRAAALADLDAV
jgi:hypothetical protein